MRGEAGSKPKPVWIDADFGSIEELSAAGPQARLANSS